MKMGHNPATRDIKNGKAVKEDRTPEQIIKGIRGNLNAHLAVTPNDTAFLLARYDEASAALVLHQEILLELEILKAQVARLRDVPEEFGSQGGEA
jgi:hypothetical protein